MGDILGLAGISMFVLAAYMKSITNLRRIASLGNATLLGYAALQAVMIVMILHAILLPANLTRLRG